MLKRHSQGWVLEIERDLNKLIERIKFCRQNKIATSIAYHGNVVDLWEALLIHYEKTGELLVDMGSDQTSCHNPFLGNFY